MTEEDNQWQNMSNYERLKMIKQNWLFLKYFKNQTEEECIAAVRQSNNALQYVHNQTAKICSEAIKVNPLALAMVINKTPALCLEAVKLNPASLQYIPASLQTLEICEKALMADGMCLRYVVNQTERLCYESLISSKGASFNLIKNQTKFLCKEAMKLDGTLLIYVSEQNFEICFEAVKQSPNAVRYVKYNNLSDKDIEVIVYEAAKRDGNVIQYIDKRFHTQKICILALQANKNNIRYMDHDKFNISLADFESVSPHKDGLITINQEYYYIIKTNVTKDSVKNIKIDNRIVGFDAFELYAKDFLNKVIKKQQIVDISLNPVTLTAIDDTPTKTNEENKESNEQENNETKQETPLSITSEIVLRRITPTRYDIYKITSNIKYRYYFYKYKEEEEEQLYKLELFKYTTGLFL